MQTAKRVNKKHRANKLLKQAGKLPSWKLLPCVALLWAQPLWALTSLNMSNQPLAGVGTAYGPNMVLALSVEFPTAGPAYKGVFLDQSATYSGESGQITQKNLGYFDYTKCYSYNEDGGFFYPTSMAKHKNTKTYDGWVWEYWGYCNGDGKDANGQEFSGAALNFLTMTSIDIFRQTMTGGNRAYGTGTDNNAYQQGDTSNATYLRRANVVDGQNKRQMGYKYIFEASLKNSNVSNWIGSLPKKVRDLVNTPGKVTAGDMYSDNTDMRNASITVESDGFQVKFFVLGTSSVKTYTIDNRWSDYFAYGKHFKTNVTSNGYTKCDWKGYGKYSCTDYTISRLQTITRNVVVKVCDPNNPTGLEANCKKQPNGSYKPEGLLQQYSKDDAGKALDANRAIRVAAMGYLNKQPNDEKVKKGEEPAGGVDGGVLRARMKTLINTQHLSYNKDETASIAVGSEWDTETGQFVVNPDNASEGNSGVINYLNKFGDRSGYKRFDPGAELYYTALRYLRHGAWNGNTHLGGNVAPYKISPNDTEKDGFPAYYDWEDPLYSTTGAQCRTNTIVYIGDTNTWNDDNLPNFDGHNVDNDDIQTETYVKKALDLEGVTNDTWKWDNKAGDEPWNTLIGSDWKLKNHEGNVSPAGMVGLAYWARTNDIRPDIPGNQYGNNFMIDVVENNQYKGGERNQVYNSFYLAAKYGGFDTTAVPNNGGFPNPNANRSSWTDDGSTSSNSNFKDGMPRNFAIANNPENMVTAMQKAMSSVGAQDNVSQTGIGSVNGQTVELDASKAGITNVTVQSQFNSSDWSGDVRVYRTSGKAAGATISENKQAVNGLIYTQVLSMGSVVTGAYHSANTYAGRPVYTLGNNGGNAVLLKSVSGVDTKAGSLMAYMMGDNTNEGTASGKYRKRGNILGTVVNSQITGFSLGGNEYFAVAANDGMLHIFKISEVGDVDSTTGFKTLKDEEVFAYMPQAVRNNTAALNEYASQGYQHRFLNDGTPTIKTIGGKTYLVGTTGRGDSKGSSTLYALDISSLGSNVADIKAYEYSDSNLGHVLGEPVVTQDKAGNAVAIVGSGYFSSTNNDKGYLYVWNLSNNTMQTVELGTAGVGAVFGYASDSSRKDGNTPIIDRIYVGDNDGKLWRVDNTSDNTWVKAYNGKAMFESAGQPITGTPYAATVNGKLYVLAGSGRYLNQADLNTTQQNYAYGLFDECSSSGNCNTIKTADLLQQELFEGMSATSHANLVIGKSSQNELQGGQRGWAVKLLPGQLIAGHADIEGRVALFPVVSQTAMANNPCATSGTTSYLFVDVLDGSMFKQPVYDTNNDGIVDSKDQNGSFISYPVLLNPEPGVVRTSEGVFVQGGKLVPPPNHPNKKFVRRMSWREIFSY